MKRKPWIYLAAIAVIFAILLPLFYLFSYGVGDSLQRTVEQGNGTQGGSTYNAPFSYGGSYLASLALGILGMAMVFSVFYILFLFKKRRRSGGE